MTNVLDTLSGHELFAAIERCEQTMETEFLKHAARVKAARGIRDDYREPCRRNHINADGDLVIASWTYILHDNGLVPLLVGTVLREHNHRLLVIVDRSGEVPVIFESKFDTRDFVVDN